ncbi:early activation antigen CD69-like isoform X2 [Hemicordylus capensis]|uniref:early activation antigen CD69-like isoform X2 n=1 Tax=Hemicordylus capensis TaxID=884348 RepID=UPI002302BF5E|nr:early activation antigen CD69-like isoform X2 [Hemicordylus capensis]XP_053157111.1 early activation antigen CD69-like isoform X2 [Hemicordylus capensis]
MEAQETSEKDQLSQKYSYPDSDPEQGEKAEMLQTAELVEDNSVRNLTAEAEKEMSETLWRRTSPMKKDLTSSLGGELCPPTADSHKKGLQRNFTSSLSSCGGFLQDTSHPSPPAAYNKICKHLSTKDAFIAVCVIVLMAAAITGFVLLRAEKYKQTSLALASSKHCGPSCPRHWIGYEGKCYYFSKEKRSWTSSQEFCASHNASLTRIESEEQALVENLKGKDAYWIGLRRDPNQPWKWSNGDNATDRGRNHRAFSSACTQAHCVDYK